MLITVQSTTVPNYRGNGSTAELRIYPRGSFFADGVEYVSGSGEFYQSVACTVASNIVTIPSFTIESTTDSTSDRATYVAELYDAVGTKVAALMGGEEFVVPPLTPTTWQSLAVYNQAPRRSRQSGVYTTDQSYSRAQVDAKISDAAFASTWDGVTGIAPSQNAVYDALASRVRRLAQNTVQVINVQDATWEDAHAYTLAANQLINVGDTVLYEFWGSYIPDGSTSLQVRLMVDSTPFLAPAAITANLYTGWRVRFTFARRNSTTIVWTADYIDNNGTVKFGGGASTLALANSHTVKMQIQTAAHANAQATVEGSFENFAGGV